MKNTQFKVEDIFGDLLSQDSFSLEQRKKLKFFLARIIWLIVFV